MYKVNLVNAAPVLGRDKDDITQIWECWRKYVPSEPDVVTHKAAYVLGCLLSVFSAEEILLVIEWAETGDDIDAPFGNFPSGFWRTPSTKDFHTLPVLLMPQKWGADWPTEFVRCRANPARAWKAAGRPRGVSQELAKAAKAVFEELRQAMREFGSPCLPNVLMSDGSGWLASPATVFAINEFGGWKQMCLKQPPAEAFLGAYSRAVQEGFPTEKPTEFSKTEMLTAAEKPKATLKREAQEPQLKEGPKPKRRTLPKQDWKESKQNKEAREKMEAALAELGAAGGHHGCEQ